MAAVAIPYDEDVNAPQRVVQIYPFIECSSLGGYMRFDELTSIKPIGRQSRESSYGDAAAPFKKISKYILKG